MPTEGAPLVSVAIPLFRSRRFVPVIRDNLKTIDYPNLEIIISDRHCADDAIDLLRELFEGDSRFRFFQCQDGLNWIDHYNWLLEAASGTYFLWMPHDDSYPSDYIPRLVSCLENQPDAALAFGRIVPVDLDGVDLPSIRNAPCTIQNRKPWTLGQSVKLLFWGAGIPFRGLFRRDFVVRSGLRLPSGDARLAADLIWVFGLSLKRRLCFVPECSLRKRYYSGSTQGSFRFRAREGIASFRVLQGYLKQLDSSRKDVFLGTVAVLLWSLMRVSRVYLGRFLPKPFKGAIRRRMPGIMG